MVFGLGPMGCIPLQRVLSSSGDCQDRANKLAVSFNRAVTKMLNKLSGKLPNASFKFGDAYDVVSDVISNPYKYGQSGTQMLTHSLSMVLQFHHQPSDKDAVKHYIYKSDKLLHWFAGFNNSDSPCCSLGNIRPALTCIPASTLCKDRSKYVFWDEYHPTDKANQIIAGELIKKFGFLRANQAKSPSLAPAVAPSPG